jgi:hypothetical protein
MDAEKYYIDKMQWESVIKEWLRQYEIIAPQQETGGLFLEPVQRNKLQAIVYHLARPVQPLKSFLLPPLEEVVGASFIPKKPWLFLGVKACDLQALPILTQAFGNDFADPLFKPVFKLASLSAVIVPNPGKPVSVLWLRGNPIRSRDTILI